MSNDHNTMYLEDSKQRFDELKASGDFEGAQAVIDDLRSNGFEKDANILATLLPSKKYPFEIMQDVSDATLVEIKKPRLEETEEEEKARMKDDEAIDLQMKRDQGYPH